MNEGSQWNRNRNNRTGNNFSKRKHIGQQSYDHKSENYSPSTSYNYQDGKSRSQAKNLPRRRIDHGGYRKDSPNHFDKLIKQNDIIIKLLKGIRDRLPAPPQVQEGIDNGIIESQSQITPPTEEANEPIKDLKILPDEIKKSNEENGKSPEDLKASSIDIEESPEDKKAPSTDVEEPPKDKKAPSTDIEESSEDKKAPSTDIEESSEDKKAPPTDIEESPKDLKEEAKDEKKPESEEVQDLNESDSKEGKSDPQKK